MEDFAGLSRQVEVTRLDASAPTELNLTRSASTTSTAPPHPQRREFHAVHPGRIEFDASQTYAWVPPYERVKIANRAACDAVIDTFEAQVARFGYSLRNIMHVRPPDSIQKYILAA